LGFELGRKIGGLTTTLTKATRRIVGLSSPVPKCEGPGAPAFQRKPVGRGRCAAAQAGLRPLGHTPPLGIIEILGVGRRAGRVLHRADPAFRIIEIRVAGVLDHVACSVVGEAR